MFKLVLMDIYYLATDSVLYIPNVQYAICQLKIDRKQATNVLKIQNFQPYILI